MGQQLNIQYPAKFYPLRARGMDYRVAKGGRGSGKSESFARLAVRRAVTERLRFLCCRELQSSIKESVHQTIKDVIFDHGLHDYFRITDTSIRSFTGAEFIFKGLHSHHNEIKSLKGIDVAWIEEAEGVSQQSLDVLIPTIRKDGSETWVSYNPETKDSPADKTFVTNAPPRSVVVDMNWRDNPWFTDKLRRDKDHCKIVDFEKYLWIWEGQYKVYAQDVIFKDKIRVDQDFVTPADVRRFYFGLDFGFGVDPLSAHRMWEKQDGDFTDLYIDHEVYGLGIELDEMHKRLWEGLPGLGSNPLMADSARPDTISHLRKPFEKGGRRWQSINCVGANKKPGSVEDGIDFLRNYRAIYIHRRCPGAKDDYQNYRWARDKRTQALLSEPVDKSNHTPDENRYALEPLIKSRVSGFDAVSRR